MSADVKAPVASGSAGLMLDEYLPYRLSIASNAVSKLIARAYEDRFGLTIPQWRLMAVLAEKPMTQQAVVVRTAMDKVTVSRAAHGLVNRHLVGRAAHEADGRSHILALTDQGRALHAEIAPLALAYEAALLSGLTPVEVETLKRLLGRLETAAGRLSGEASLG
jgi:DNA-binding MarR family transcriptional regulator